MNKNEKRTDNIPYDCMIGRHEIAGGASVSLPLSDCVLALWEAGYSAPAIAAHLGYRHPSSRGAAKVLALVPSDMAQRDGSTGALGVPDFVEIPRVLIARSSKTGETFHFLEIEEGTWLEVSDNVFESTLEEADALRRSRFGGRTYPILCTTSFFTQGCSTVTDSYEIRSPWSGKPDTPCALLQDAKRINDAWKAGKPKTIA